MKKLVGWTMLLSLLFLASCGKKENKGEALDNQETKPVVKLAKVEARPVPQLLEYTATVEAEVKNNIAPASPLRIDRIAVEVGDRVSKGQKLVQMDGANLKQLKLQLENQQVEFKRVDELYKIGGVSKSEWDASKMALDVKESSYRNLLENTALVSPINGVVTARNYDNGDLYNGSTPILVVEQITPVKLLINVSEQYFTQLKVGMAVDIKLDVYKEESFQGKISLVYPTIDPITRTFNVEIKIPNLDRKVRPGMFARATLDLGAKDRVVVPDLAVVKQAGSGDRFIYVYEDGKVFYRKIELGRRMGEEIELLSGVKDHAQVVVAGQSRLLDGIEVQVEK